MTVKIFFCYAHEDEALLNKLKTHLRPLQRRGLIDVWYDRDISAGTDWEWEINKHLNTSQIILLLISPDFMDSDYCFGIEMQRAIERHERGEATVIPIILRHALWQGEPLGKLQALPKDAKPVKSWPDLDEALNDVAEGIHKVVSEKTVNNFATVASSHNLPSIDEQVSLWMQDIASKSEYTKRSYEENIASFRRVLQKHELDLNSEDLSVVPALLQNWAAQGTRRENIANNTFNQRIFIMRSFYKFALNRHWIKINPIEMVELREKSNTYESKPLDPEKVKNALKKINRLSYDGKRDYALLCLLLTTGLSSGEVAGLRYGDIERTEDGVIITYRQKGGKFKNEKLQKGTVQALIDYFTTIFDKKYPPDYPLWLSFAHYRTGLAIGKQSISDICQKHLHTSKVYTISRTYQALKDEVGITGIEKCLGINEVESSENLLISSNNST